MIILKYKYEQLIYHIEELHFKIYNLTQSHEHIIKQEQMTILHYKNQIEILNR